MRYHPQTQELIRQAARKARELGHSYVGSAHLLLALAEQPGATGQLLLRAPQTPRGPGSAYHACSHHTGPESTLAPYQSRESGRGPLNTTAEAPAGSAHRCDENKT